ncbi:MAG: hypothetical protein FJW23_08805 [Acidimicrobiia bacterium]|nr:hypothetical protein [Acidimicrobiia bacterium]
MNLRPRLPPPEGRAADVVGVGENSLDYVLVVPAFPAPDSKVPLTRFDERAGGQVATAMAACARLGWRARYVGVTGDDDAGQLARTSLLSEGVDVGAVVTLPGIPSRTAVILVDESTGGRTVMEWRHPGLTRDPATLAPEVVLDGRLLLVDSCDLPFSVAAATIAHAAGIPVVVDVDTPRPGLDSLLERSDVIIAAEGLPRALTGAATEEGALRELAAQYPGATTICVTLGYRGCVTYAGGAGIHTPAVPVRCVDSTGAGDVFRAGFMAAWLRLGDGAPLDRVLAYASAAAAFSCRGAGARGALPRHADVEQLLHSA